MKKKLPNLYVNRIEKKLNNNHTVFYSALESPKMLKPTMLPEVEGASIEDKIDRLFNLPDYVYKKNATITLKDKNVITKDIIGQINNKLVTLDEELIDIDDIIDIKY